MITDSDSDSVSPATAPVAAGGSTSTSTSGWETSVKHPKFYLRLDTDHPNHRTAVEDLLDVACDLYNLLTAALFANSVAIYEWEDSTHARDDKPALLLFVQQLLENQMSNPQTTLGAFIAANRPILDGQPTINDLVKQLLHTLSCVIGIARKTATDNEGKITPVSFSEWRLRTKSLKRRRTSVAVSADFVRRHGLNCHSLTSGDLDGLLEESFQVRLGNLVGQGQALYLQCCRQLRSRPGPRARLTARWTAELLPSAKEVLLHALVFTRQPGMPALRHNTQQMHHVHPVGFSSPTRTSTSESGSGSGLPTSGGFVVANNDGVMAVSSSSSSSSSSGAGAGNPSRAADRVDAASGTSLTPMEIHLRSRGYVPLNEARQAQAELHRSDDQPWPSLRAGAINAMLNQRTSSSTTGVSNDLCRVPPTFIALKSVSPSLTVVSSDVHGQLRHAGMPPAMSSMSKLGNSAASTTTTTSVTSSGTSLRIILDTDTDPIPFGPSPIIFFLHPHPSLCQFDVGASREQRVDNRHGHHRG